MTLAETSLLTRIEQAAGCTPTSAEMHGLMDEVLAHDSGELVRSSSNAWSSAL